MGQLAAVQVGFRRKTGLVRDTIVNTFHFQCEPLVEVRDEAANIVAQLILFYGQANTPEHVNPILYYFSSIITGAVDYKVYDLSDPKPRPPVYEHTDTFAVPATEPLPAEVAFVLSYKADDLPGVPARRRRGRVYLGPLNTRAIDAGFDTGDARPVQEFMDTVRVAGKQLMTAPMSCDWVVHSVTGGTNAIVTEVSTDDAWDTQRRRGADPTKRERIAGGLPDPT